MRTPLGKKARPRQSPQSSLASRVEEESVYMLQTRVQWASASSTYKRSDEQSDENWSVYSFQAATPNDVCFDLSLVFYWKDVVFLCSMCFVPFVLTFCELVALRLSLQYSSSIVLILDEVQSLEIRFLTLNIHHCKGVLRTSMTLINDALSLLFPHAVVKRIIERN